MANLNIIKHPNDKILRKVSEPIKEVTDKLRKFAGNMHITMVKNGGVGLAAPQVARNIRLIVINTMLEDKKAGCKRTMYNPVIISTSDETINMQEGCLSFSRTIYKLDRPASCVVKYVDTFNKEITEEFKGITARAVIHEIEHLDGRLFIDLVIEQGNKKNE